MKRNALPNDFKRIVFERAKGKCEVCSQYCAPILNIHHIKPVSEGGKDWPDNLIALCPNCHAYVHFGRRNHRNWDAKFWALMRTLDCAGYTDQQESAIGLLVYADKEDYKDIINTLSQEAER